MSAIHKKRPHDFGQSDACVALADVLSKVDDLQFHLHQLRCMSMITEDRTQDVFVGTGKHHSDPGYFYFADEDREVLGFVVGDISEKARSIGDETDRILLALKEVRDLLKRGEANDATVS